MCIVICVVEYVCESRGEVGGSGCRWRDFFLFWELRGRAGVGSRGKY